MHPRRNTPLLKNLDVKAKRVLVRADYNVPLKDGTITNDKRIRASIPTITELLAKGAKQIILASHLGRPKGKPDPSLSLKPVAKHLSTLLHKEVSFIPTPTPQTLPDNTLVLLENLRFDPGEEANDPSFTKKLVRLADCFVFDAFGTAHRSHASTVGIPAHLPSAMGLLVEKELRYLTLANADHPLIAIFGAAKVKDKLPLLTALLQHADSVLLGGAIVFTFMKAQGYSIGKSLVDNESLDLARTLSEQHGERLTFPRDFIVAEDAKPDLPTKTVPFHKIPPTLKGLDVGPKTVALFLTKLEKAKTVIWNGPLGVAEIPAFAKSTQDVARFLTTHPSITSIVGGGDTAAVLETYNLTEGFTHVSTGGGAALKALAGEPLPAIEALNASKKKHHKHT